MLLQAILPLFMLPSVFLVVLFAARDTGDATRHDQLHIEVTATSKHLQFNNSVKSAHAIDTLGEGGNIEPQDPFLFNELQPARGNVIVGSAGRAYNKLKVLLFWDRDTKDSRKLWSVADRGSSKPIAAIKVTVHSHGHNEWMRQGSGLSGLVKEAVAMEKCAGSPYVVNMLDRFKDRWGHYFIIMDIVSGLDLHDLIDMHERGISVDVDPDSMALIFYDILRGLDWMHMRGVSHLALMLESIWIMDELRAKIMYFEFAGDTTTPKSGRIEHDFRPFASPERHAAAGHDGDTYLGPEVDVFALGVLLFSMVTGEPPYSQASCALPGTSYYPTPDHITVLRRRNVPAKILEIIECTQREKICIPEQPRDECRCEISDIMKMAWIKEAMKLDVQASAATPDGKYFHPVD